MDVATANGLVLFDPSDSTSRQRQILSRKDGLISDQVTDVAFSSTGTDARHTRRPDVPHTIRSTKSFYAFQGLVNNHVYTLAIDAGYRTAS